MIDLNESEGLRKRTAVAFLLVLVGHLVLISAQVQTTPGVPLLEAATFGVFARVQAATASVVNFAANGWGNYVGLRGARVENDLLRRQLAELEVRLQEQRTLVARTERLQELLDLRRATSLPTLAADVIAANPEPGRRTVTVDRGSADGVQADMAVIAPKGVVGRVVGQPAQHASRVQLIIDPAAALGVLDERSRVGGMVVGIDADPPLRLQLVSNLADVVPGDQVVTSGVDGVYPRGFPIGTVEKSERGAGLHRQIAVRPTVHFSSLEEVLIVLVPARPVIRPEAAAPAAPSK